MEKVDLRKYCQDTYLGPLKKGRSESRISRRDEKLAARFYYYSEIRKINNYSKILSQLSEEFDIDEGVVSYRMKKRADLLDKIYSEKPSIHLLRAKYPYFSWQP